MGQEERSTGLRFLDEDRAPWLIGVVGLGTLGAVYLRTFGLPGADLHGPLHRVGIMDPFCGGTRATYVLVRGDIGAAWSWNPLVPLLAIATVVAVVRFAVGLSTHRWLTVDLPRRAWLTFVAGVLAIVEVNQQLQAERLMEVVPT